MRLANASRFFDSSVADDAYTPGSPFKCQLAPLEIYKIDATAVRRRAMSCGANVTIPTRQCITIDGVVYLVGASTPDFWKGARVRNNHVMQAADALADIYSVADALAGNAPAQAYAAINFNKEIQDSRLSSDYHAQYYVYFSGSETAAAANHLIHAQGKWLLVRMSYVSVSGLTVCLSNEIEGPQFETVQYGDRVYNPVTDSYSSTTKNVKVLRIRWTEWFDYVSLGTENFVRGDLQVMVLKSEATPSAGDILTMSDGDWRVLTVSDDGATWTCHTRRV